MQFRRGRRRLHLWIPIIVAALAVTTVASSHTSSAKQSAKPQVSDAYGHLPLSFEENRGQTDAQVKFLARGGGYSLFLTPTEAVLKLRAPSKSAKPGAMPIAFHPDDAEQKLSVVRIKFEGANPNSTASGVDVLPGRSNYFIGKDRSKWHTGIATYGGVRFESVYPGINLVYRGTQGRLEYDLVIAANADPSRIKMEVEGADDLRIDGNGDLVIKTSGGEVIQKAPVIYQDVDGARHPIDGGYTLTGKHTVTFKLGAYNRQVPLIIDPLLAYASYLGGSGSDEGVANAVDSTGAAWVTGSTRSTDFPVSPDSLQPTNFGNFDVFISKLSPDGTSLAFSTYLGGSLPDGPGGIGVDADGNVYVGGGRNRQTSYSSDLPVTTGAFQPKTNAGEDLSDALVARIVPSPRLSPTTTVTATATASPTTTIIATVTLTATSTPTVARSPLPTHTVTSTPTTPTATPTTTMSATGVPTSFGRLQPRRSPQLRR